MRTFSGKVQDLFPLTNVAAQGRRVAVRLRSSKQKGTRQLSDQGWNVEGQHVVLLCIQDSIE